ncbi:hypothetical protein GCM10009785_19530 [Brooklawnia cerclae]|uniref:Sugar (Pentulose or hexulose) kinase n=1 Tax=Brooklawnia cerclae TaxID=349934 RepID=A0ABX0SGK0_9ACTN|nr:FGGY family carbohydrate kinase [Brooklawnia cerclae]NIH57474.1 sugar (pentulose or hexulose) kinase [Brooklawnia cerclae]
MASDDFEIGLGRAVDPLVLAIDIGSTASRGSLYDALGRPVKPREKRPHAFVSTPDGTSVIDPDQVVDEVSQIISGLVDDAGNRPIAAVAMDTFASSLVGVDRRHRAITPCFTYNDSRCADQVAWLRDNADEQEIQDRTGCRFHASYLPARLRWLAETQHTVWRRATQWMSLGEYVYLSLLGHTAAGTSTAAWSGLLNRRSGRWDEPALELARIDPGKLSLIADPEQTLHASAGSTAHSRWRPLRGARWFAPLGDGYSSTLGVGTAPGGVVINLATSGAMRRLVDDPVGTDGLDVPTGL